MWKEADVLFESSVSFRLETLKQTRKQHITYLSCEQSCFRGREGKLIRPIASDEQARTYTLWDKQNE